MQTPELSAEFTPYLDSSVWGGHFIGDCTPTPLNKDYPGGAGYRFAGEILGEALPQMQSLFPLQTFYKGTTFIPADHRPGTIIAFKRTQLIQDLTPTHKQRPYERVPEPPFSLNFGVDEGRPRLLKEAGLILVKAMNWGVVVEAKNNQRKLVNYGAEEIIKVSGSRMLIGAGSPEYKQLPVGETRHTTLGNGAEILDRIDTLIICSYGRQQRKRKRVAQAVKSIIPMPIAVRPGFSTAQQA